MTKAGRQPHRLRRYLSSNDPEFEEKAADIIGLYLKPPVHAAGVVKKVKEMTDGYGCDIYMNSTKLPSFRIICSP